MVSQWLKCLQKANALNSNIVKEKMKLPFMIYADFENMFVPKHNAKQNPD